MNYGTGRQIEVGDAVLADGMTGIVVCDFDNQRFAEGFGDWNAPSAEMLGGGRLSSGIMVRTEEAGLIHYSSGMSGLELRSTAPDRGQ